MHIDGGVNIDLINYSAIVSYSPIYLHGNEHDLIKIFSSDTSGMGISVINAEDFSVITNTFLIIYQI